ncbi:uncharacterized protein LOC134533404 [Bacillus rossius redtenbacheri]|uniref:uncharacterized protein LOC134533404 n=1 Tax=Bacillus rossius redtenbacheri TaxID=93214 RepID=UPI002FDC9104
MSAAAKGTTCGGRRGPCACRAEGPRGRLSVWRVEQLPGVSTQQEAEEKLRCWARAGQHDLAALLNHADRSAAVWSSVPDLGRRLEAGARACGQRLNVQPGAETRAWLVRGCDPPADSHRRAVAAVRAWSGEPARAFVLRFECRERPFVVWSTRHGFGDRLLAGAAARGVLLDVRPTFLPPQQPQMTVSKAQKNDEVLP